MLFCRKRRDPRGYLAAELSLFANGNNVIPFASFNRLQEEVSCNWLLLQTNITTRKY